MLWKRNSPRWYSWVRSHHWCLKTAHWKTSYILRWLLNSHALIGAIIGTAMGIIIVSGWVEIGKWKPEPAGQYQRPDSISMDPSWIPGISPRGVGTYHWPTHPPFFENPPTWGGAPNQPPAHPKSTQNQVITLEKNGLDFVATPC